MALVQYCEKNEGAANIEKVTADEYAHHKMTTLNFEVSIPKNWSA